MAPSSRDARDLRHKPDAARALDAARHEGLDEGAEIFLLDGALVLAVAAAVEAVIHRLVLQIALAALVADGAIERMIDEQELHYAFARLPDERRIGMDDRGGAVTVRPQIADIHGAGRHRLRDAADLHEAHAAVTRDGQPLMVTEARDLRSRLLAGLEQGDAVLDFDLLAVDIQLGHFFPSLRLRPGCPLCHQGMACGNG